MARKLREVLGAAKANTALRDPHSEGNAERSGPMPPPTMTVAFESNSAYDVRGNRKTTRSARNSEGAKSERHSMSNDERPVKSVRGGPRSPTSGLRAAEAADVVMRDFAPGAQPISRSQDSTPKGAMTEQPSSASHGVSTGLSALLEVFDEKRAELLNGLADGKRKKHPDDVSATSWQSTVYMTCNFTNYEAKAEIMQYFAADLVRCLSVDWHNSELYKWAKQNAKNKPSFDYCSEEQILSLTRRQKKSRPSETRDPGSKRSPATPEKIGKRPRGRPSGKKAGLRPSMGSKKRPWGLESDDSDAMDVDDIQLAKRTAKTSQYFDDGDSDEMANAISSDDDDQDNKKELLRAVLHAEKLPSKQSKGPNGTWTCEEPDCGYVVRSAEGLEGQELISNHFAEHERQAIDEAKARELSKINLVMQERGHMPIEYAYFPPHFIKIHYHRFPVCPLLSFLSLTGFDHWRWHHLADEPAFQGLLIYFYCFRSFRASGGPLGFFKGSIDT
jgi:hypothetical protein